METVETHLDPPLIEPLDLYWKFQVHCPKNSDENPHIRTLSVGILN